MSNLEKLTLSVRIRGRTSFIDGIYLHNYILSKMPHLHTFICDIATQFIVSLGCSSINKSSTL